MMESLSKAAEVAAETADKSPGVEIDPDARIDTKNDSHETTAESDIDPDARVEDDSGEKRGLTPEEKEQLQELVINEMQNAIKLSVPLFADCGWGTNWLEAH